MFRNLFGSGRLAGVFVLVVLSLLLFVWAGLTSGARTDREAPETRRAPDSDGTRDAGTSLNTG